MKMSEVPDYKEKLVCEIIRKMSGEYKHQLGKTAVQKMTYLVSRESAGGFNYSLYHYGPYSGDVSYYLDTCNQNGLIKINWKGDSGYEITPNNSINFAEDLKSEDRETVESIVDKYAQYNAVELSLIATAFYVKDQYTDVDSEELVKIVQSLKPNYKERVRDILKGAKIIQ